MIILESKLSVPYFSPYLIRTRLFSYLENHLDRSLVSLTSIGGYGKTTLLSSFVKERSIPAIWYQLSHQDRNPRTFLSYLKTAITRKIIGNSAICNIKLGELEEEMGRLVDVLSTWPKRMVIVLDNYQYVDQCEEIENILANLILGSSPSVTFVIAGRTRPNLQLDHLKLQHKWSELTTRDLAFSKEEIFQFFVHLHRVHLYGHEVDTIFNKTEGWVTGLRLLQDSIKDMNDTERAAFWTKFNGTEDIYDYLGAEIVALQSEEIREFLYKTSLLIDLNPDVIDKYLETNHSSAKLEQLLANHLFIYKTDQGTIKYHKLFRSFLFKELSKRKSREEIDGYHNKLSQIYEHRYDFINAFVHSIIGRNFLNAAALKKRMKEHLNRSQFFDLNEKMLNMISPDLSFTSFSLFLYRCIPLEVIKDLTKSLEVKYKDVKDDMDPAVLTHFQHSLAVIYYLIGEMDQSEELCGNSLQESINTNNHEMICKNLALRSLLYWYTGKHEAAVQCAQEMLSYSDSHLHFHSHFSVVWVLAQYYMDQKQFALAESFIQELLKLSEQRSDCTNIFPYSAYGRYCRLLGKHEEALVWLGRAEDIAIHLDLGYDLGKIYMEMAVTLLETGQWESAEQYLSKSEQYLSGNKFLTNQTKRMKIAVKEMGNAQSIAESKINAETLLVVTTKPKQKLTIRVLGNFGINIGDKPITLKRKSSLRLLQYFISLRGSRLTKDSIIRELFPEGSTESNNNHFYVTVSYLRKALQPDLKSGKDSFYIKQSGNVFSFCMDNVDLDVHEFTKLIRSNGETGLERIEKLKKAEQLYRGDLFEGYPYVHFLDLEREYLRNAFIKILLELACYYWIQTDYAQGIEYFEKALQKEPYDEEIYIEYIQRLLEANLHFQAKKVSERCQRCMEYELGIPVRDKLRNLFKQYSEGYTRSLMKTVSYYEF